MTDQEDIVPADVAEEEDHEDEQEEPEEEEPSGKADPKSSRKAPRTKKTTAAGNRKKGSRMEAKAGFPVSKIRRMLKDSGYAKSVQKDAGIYLTGVIEYVCAEILELAGNSVKETKKNRIIPRNIQLAIRNDEELNKYMSNVTVRSFRTSIRL